MKHLRIVQREICDGVFEQTDCVFCCNLWFSQENLSPRKLSHKLKQVRIIDHAAIENLLIIFKQEMCKTLSC